MSNVSGNDTKNLGECSNNVSRVGEETWLNLFEKLVIVYSERLQRCVAVTIWRVTHQK